MFVGLSNVKFPIVRSLSNVIDWLAVRPAVANVAVLFAPSATMPPVQLVESLQLYGPAAPAWDQLLLWAAATAGIAAAANSVK